MLAMQQETRHARLMIEGMHLPVFAIQRLAAPFLTGPILASAGGSGTGETAVWHAQRKRSPYLYNRGFEGLQEGGPFLALRKL